MSKLVMVVDDEEDFLYEVKTMIEREGLECITATSGPDAIKKLDSARPDLILLDVMMPDLDGWKLAKMIKKKANFKNTPIAMLTVKSSLEDKVVSLDESGAVWHISKPIEREKFIDTVNWLLKSPPR
jgi:DNA-binding response OmpR family regulator